ncbi:DUF3987 domain-containing protein, partial [Geminicoccus flavidas]|uniref:DUF3987 domain-containing protein n=1 Tax=Geminicoccus flavidas TaxID=2506407 RepID=UPI001356CCBF
MSAKSLKLAVDNARPADEVIADAWPDLDRSITELRHLPAPDFPLDTFGGFAPWVRDAADAKGTPADFVAAAVLSVIGGMIANVRRGSPWAGWIEPPIIWAALVGLPSTGKSPALDAVVDLLGKMEQSTNSDWSEREKEHQRAKAEAKAKLTKWEGEVAEAVKLGKPAPKPPEGDLDPEPPEMRRLVLNDVTIERA